MAVAVAGGGSQKTTDVRVDMFVNRGDVAVAVDGEYLNTRKGLVLSTVNEGLRDNTATGGAQEYGVTMSTAFDEEWSIVTAAADNISGSDEHNLNFAATYIGFNSGFKMAVNDQFDDSFSFGDPYETTKIDVDLAGVNALTDGVLIAAPYGNDDNFASAEPKADGSGWEVRVFDNTYDQATDLRTEPDAASWVYLPYDTENLQAAGRVAADGTILSSTDNEGVEWTLSRENDGFGFAQYRLSFTDSSFNPTNGMLLLTSTGAFESDENRDNSMLYEADGGDFIIRGLDHVSDGQEGAFADYEEAGFMFAYVDFDLALVAPQQGLPGDFNNDGLVDSADYTVWRDNVGSEDDSVLNGNGNGVSGVDANDYELWAANYGSSIAVSTTTAIPEPAALLLASLAGALVATRRRVG